MQVAARTDPGHRVPKPVPLEHGFSADPERRLIELHQPVQVLRQERDVMEVIDQIRARALP